MRAIDVGRRRSGKHIPENKRAYVAADRERINARRRAWRARRRAHERAQQRIRLLRRIEEPTEGELAQLHELSQRYYTRKRIVSL